MGWKSLPRRHHLPVIFDPLAFIARQAALMHAQGDCLTTFWPFSDHRKHPATAPVMDAFLQRLVTILLPLGTYC
jgi:hypothetical protein